MTQPDVLFKRSWGKFRKTTSRVYARRSRRKIAPHAIGALARLPNGVVRLRFRCLELGGALMRPKYLWYLSIAAPALVISAGCAGSPSAARHARSGHNGNGLTPDRKLAIAQVFEQQGRLDNAKQLYSDVQRSGPGSDEATERLQLIAAYESGNVGTHAAALALAYAKKAAAPVEPAASVELQQQSTAQAAPAPMKNAILPIPNDTEWEKPTFVEPIEEVMEQPALANNREGIVITPRAGLITTSDEADLIPGGSSVILAGNDEIADDLREEDFMLPSIEETRSALESAESATPDLQQLAENLSSDDTSVRIDAALRLARDDAAAALPQLKDALSDSNLFVQAFASRAVWHIEQNPETVMPVLVDLLNTEKPQVQQLACYLLGNIGQEAVVGIPMLKGLLKSEDAFVRVHAAEAIMRITQHDSESTELLVESLRHEDSDVRWLAAYVLPACGTEFVDQIVTELADSLSDEDPEVCTISALALGELGNAATPAVEALVDARDRGNEQIKEAAIIALSCIESDQETSTE